MIITEPCGRYHVEYGGSGDMASLLASLPVPKAAASRREDDAQRGPTKTTGASVSVKDHLGDFDDDEDDVGEPTVDKGMRAIVEAQEDALVLHGVEESKIQARPSQQERDGIAAETRRVLEGISGAKLYATAVSTRIAAQAIRKEDQYVAYASQSHAAAEQDALEGAQADKGGAAGATPFQAARHGYGTAESAAAAAAAAGSATSGPQVHGDGSGARSGGARKKPPERILRVVEAAVDPLEPGRRRNRELEREAAAERAGSPPPLVAHSPTRAATAEERELWDVPEVVSAWKNPKAHVVALDKRVMAQHQGGAVTVSSKFAALTDVLDAAVSMNRAAVQERAAQRKQVDAMRRERELAAARDAAAKAQESMAAIGGDAQVASEHMASVRRKQDVENRVERRTQYSSTASSGIGPGADAKGSGMLYDERLFRRGQASGGNSALDNDDVYGQERSVAASSVYGLPTSAMEAALPESVRFVKENKGSPDTASGSRGGDDAGGRAASHGQQKDA